MLLMLEMIYKESVAIAVHYQMVPKYCEEPCTSNSKFYLFVSEA